MTNSKLNSVASRCIGVVTLAVLLVQPARPQPDFGSVIAQAPTDINTSLQRGGPGAFSAPRENGKHHTGVDIVANQSSPDKNIYRVMAVSAGTVAYARLNGTEETNYGYTIVIDHKNGFYTQYSHLAINASKNIVKVGDNVSAGQVIGYLADLANNEKSSGNVRADVVLPYDKIQLHFEIYEAPTGRKSATVLSIIKQGYTLDDPTSRLKDLHYKSF